MSDATTSTKPQDIQALSKRVWQPWTRIKEVDFWQWSIENTITSIVANHYPDGSVDDAVAEIATFAKGRVDQIAAEIEIKAKELAMWRAVGDEYGAMVDGGEVAHPGEA